MNWGTLLVLAALLVCVYLAVMSLVRDKKAGKSSCGGNCQACHGGCSCSGHLSDEQILKMAREAELKNNNS